MKADNDWPATSASVGQCLFSFLFFYVDLDFDLLLGSSCIFVNNSSESLARSSTIHYTINFNFLIFKHIHGFPQHCNIYNLMCCNCNCTDLQTVDDHSFHLVSTAPKSSGISSSIRVFSWSHHPTCYYLKTT